MLQISQADPVKTSHLENSTVAACQVERQSQPERSPGNGGLQ